MSHYNSSHYIWSSLMKVALVLLLLIFFFIVGLILGYGVLGDGKISDVFKPETWQHILDFVRA